MYAMGLGVDPDLDEAERLLRYAAEHGVPSAEKSLKMVQASPRRL
jgi:TPR repeat protein